MAIDAQGATQAKPFVDRANAEFPCLVDEEGRLGQLLGFKAIPNGVLIDEAGVIRYKKFGGFDIRRAETRRLVEEWAAGADIGRELASQSVAPSAQAFELFERGLALYKGGKAEEATELWRQAVALDPENYVIRKQLWAVENPERFYDGEIDTAWQREQMAQGR